MLLVAITGIEIVIIYVRAFDGPVIITVLSVCSVIKFVGVMTWFMHLRWDKILNTVLFLMGLVIAVFTFFAVMYMLDNPPVVEEFSVTPIEQDWEAKTDYAKGDYTKHNDSYYVAEIAHQSGETFSSQVTLDNEPVNSWKKVEGIPHQIS